MDKQNLAVKYWAEKMGHELEVSTLKDGLFSIGQRHADCSQMLCELLNDKGNGLTKATRNKLARFLLQDAMKAKFMGVNNNNLIKVFDEAPNG